MSEYFKIDFSYKDFGFQGIFLSSQHISVQINCLLPHIMYIFVRAAPRHGQAN
jgi:hypothetical protein